MKTRILAAGGVVRNGNNIALVAMRNIMGFGFPKGKIESGEDALTAAIREIIEETGVTELSLVCSLGAYERPVAVGDTILDISMFLFDTKTRILSPQDNTTPEARWFPISEVSSALVLPQDRDFWEKRVLATPTSVL